MLILVQIGYCLAGPSFGIAIVSEESVGHFSGYARFPSPFLGSGLGETSWDHSYGPVQAVSWIVVAAFVLKHCHLLVYRARALSVSALLVARFLA